MKVVFYDKEHETFERVEDVRQLYVDYRRIENRLCKVWIVQKDDDSWKTFKCNKYELERVGK